MFDIFDLIVIITEVMESKSKRLSNTISTITGHIFMTIITGGLWVPFAFLTRKKRKNKKRV